PPTRAAGSAAGAARLAGASQKLGPHGGNVPGGRDDPGHQARLELEAAAFQPGNDRPERLELDDDEQRAVERAGYRGRERLTGRRHHEVVDPTDEHHDGDREQGDRDGY